ncbi:MAG: hypothetical protein WD688_16100, partial [Candidatus Binatia bacterium]
MEANLKSRLITGFIGIPLLVLLIGWGYPWLFQGIFFLFIIVGLREYFAMVFPGHVRDQLFGIASGFAVS